MIDGKKSKDPSEAIDAEFKRIECNQARWERLR